MPAQSALKIARVANVITTIFLTLQNINVIYHRSQYIRACLKLKAGSLYLAGATGLEPATSGVTGRRSNQLNYAPNLFFNSSNSQPSRNNSGRSNKLNYAPQF